MRGLKENFLLNAFDGSEDHLASDKLYVMVGPQMVTLPKGITIKAAPGRMPPPDEGTELFDCDSDELEDGELLHYEEDSDELLESSCSTPSHADVMCLAVKHVQ